MQHYFNEKNYVKKKNKKENGNGKKEFCKSLGNTVTRAKKKIKRRKRKRNENKKLKQKDTIERQKYRLLVFIILFFPEINPIYFKSENEKEADFSVGHA